MSDERASRPDAPARRPSRLGPPGWGDYQRARAAFFRALAVQALEDAWTRPGRTPDRTPRSPA